MKAPVESILDTISPDWRKTEGMERTPKRVEDMLLELTSGVQITEPEVDGLISSALFPNTDTFSGVVAVKDIRFTSLCEHHMLPFYGSIDIYYMPSRYLLGLSKFARVVDIYSRRLQVQERLTSQVLYALQRNLCASVAVVCRAKHSCMIIRGIKTPDAVTQTIDYMDYLDTLGKGESKWPQAILDSILSK